MEILRHLKRLPEYNAIETRLEASSMVFNESDFEDIIDEEQIELNFNE